MREVHPPLDYYCHFIIPNVGMQETMEKSRRKNRKKLDLLEKKTFPCSIWQIVL